MLTESQSKRITTRSADVLLKAIEQFPQLLADCDPDKAAAIVADLVKAQLDRADPTADPAAALEQIIKRAAQSVGEDYDD